MDSLTFTLLSSPVTKRIRAELGAMQMAEHPTEAAVAERKQQ
jgi:hypothetical protein